jgi:pilus assembly protein CpaB
LGRIRGLGRVLAIVAALVLAGIATYAITTYIRGIEDRAFADAELVEVFVAQQEIPQGLSAAAAGEAGLIERGTIPSRNLPEGAITSLEQISGLVSAERILTNEVLVRGRWIDPSDASVAAIEIPENFEAISVQVEVPPGVAGFIRGGDQVSLIATLEIPGEQTIEEDGTIVEAPPDIRTQYLLQGIQVLTVGQRVVTEEGADGVQESAAQVLLTVALEPEDAEKLVFAIQNASLYFTLLPDGAEPADTTGRTLENFFD